MTSSELDAARGRYARVLGAASAASARDARRALAQVVTMHPPAADAEAVVCGRCRVPYPCLPMDTVDDAVGPVAPPIDAYAGWSAVLAICGIPDVDGRVVLPSFVFLRSRRPVPLSGLGCQGWVTWRRVARGRVEAGGVLAGVGLPALDEAVPLMMLARVDGPVDRDRWRIDRAELTRVELALGCRGWPGHSLTVTRLNHA